MIRFNSTKERFFAVVFFLCCFGISSKRAFAQNDNHRFGAGIILGTPSGIVGKYWISHDKAVDFGFASYFGELFLFHANHLWHYPKAFGSATPIASQLTPYIGFGGEIIITTNSSTVWGRYFSNGSLGLGIRIPVGIEWRPVEPRLGIFIELAPGVGIIPGTYGFLQGGLGVRYYF